MSIAATIRVMGKLTVLTLASMGVVITGAAAQEGYPSRSITLVAPYAAGGGFDTVTRLLAEALGKNLKQKVIVENVTGAGGVIGSEKVAQASPDGYTLLLEHTGLATAPLLIKNLPFNPLRSFSFVGLFAHSPMLLVGSNSLPPTNIQELVKYIKKSPSNVTIASSGVGSGTDLCALLFQQAIGTKFTRVQYRGAAPGLMDVEAGRVGLLCETPFGLISHIRAGKIKPFVLTGDKRLSILPSVPTAAQAGLKEFAGSIWYALYAPAKTPAPIIERLSLALQAAVQNPTVVRHLKVFAMTPYKPSQATPNALREQLSSQIALFRKVFRQAGIVPK